MSEHQRHLLVVSVRTLAGIAAIALTLYLTEADGIGDLLLAGFVGGVIASNRIILLLIPLLIGAVIVIGALSSGDGGNHELTDTGEAVLMSILIGIGGLGLVIGVLLSGAFVYFRRVRRELR